MNCSNIVLAFIYRMLLVKISSLFSKKVNKVLNEAARFVPHLGNFFGAHYCSHCWWYIWRRLLSLGTHSKIRRKVFTLARSVVINLSIISAFELKELSDNQGKFGLHIWELKNLAFGCILLETLGHWILVWMIEFCLNQNYMGIKIGF